MAVSHLYCGPQIDWQTLKEKAEHAARGGVEVHLHNHAYQRPCNDGCIVYEPMGLDEMKRRWPKEAPLPPISEAEIEAFKSELRGDTLT